jgi:UTP--glucose-1-phosphate uridylyltransferase
MEIDETLTLADLKGAADRWRTAGRPDVPRARLEWAAATASGLIAGHAPVAAGPLARFCLVTKGPHLTGPRSLACVTARLLAFGVGVHGLHRVGGTGAHVAATLYPRAVRHFTHGPSTPSQWARLDERFGTPEFERIFGRPYDRSLVVPGARVIRENGLTAARLTEIWEGGRPPATREKLTARYGAPAAEFILAGRGAGDTYEWFRGPLPVGISRIGPAMTAFAMRDERLAGGAPVIVVNGHVPGLSALFTPESWVFDLGLQRGGVSIGDIRRYLAGADGRPGTCEPGSLRRDGATGDLPLSSPEPVTSRLNLVHCSDGMLAGLLEARRLTPARTGAPDLLTAALLDDGLTEPELRALVWSDPLVRPGRLDGYLSDRTAGLDLDGCLAEIRAAVPPVFGPSNGFADGVTLEVLSRALRSTGRAAPDGCDSGPRTVMAVPGDGEEEAGRAAIGQGHGGVVTPAGGTGGRFGGYHRAESDPARQKVLAPLFTVAGRRLSALDIRMANIRHWDGGDGDRVPAAMMASPTSRTALHRWRERLDAPYRTAVSIFAQHGLYRLDAALARTVARERWFDAILRDRDGRPSLKPSGTLGLFSAFVLAGLLDVWERRGVRYLAIANGDDVGFRLDPRAVGHLERHPAADALVVGVPWGWSGTVRTLRVRGDASGWAIAENGTVPPGPMPPADRAYDHGGALRIRPTLSIVESDRPAGDLFSTNQIYLRVAAVRRLLVRTEAPDPLEAVRRLTATAPAPVEEKTVPLDGATRRGRQIAQPFHAILRLLHRCDVLVGTRQVGPGVRGTHATLKRPEDVPFAQLVVDRLAAHDELAVAPAWSA